MNEIHFTAILELLKIQENSIIRGRYIKSEYYKVGKIFDALELTELQMDKMSSMMEIPQKIKKC